MSQETKYINYRGTPHLVVREFTTGNGTYDMVMYEVTDGKEVFMLPSIDIQEENTDTEL